MEHHTSIFTVELPSFKNSFRKFSFSLYTNLKRVFNVTNQLSFEGSIKLITKEYFSTLCLFVRLHFTILNIFYSNHIPVESEIYESSLGPNVRNRGRTFPSYEEMRQNVALALVNTHVSLSTATSTPPNYINIGGFHVNTDVKPLPEVRYIRFRVSHKNNLKLNVPIFLFIFPIGPQENNGIS